MKPRSYLQKIILGGTLSLLITIPPFHVVAASGPAPSLVQSGQPDVFITEIQTATSSSASEEFIEFYNATDATIDFTDAAHGGKDIWKLQYFSGSKLNASGVLNWATPTGSIDLSTMANTTIAAHDYYLLATTKSDGNVYQPGGIEADGHYSAKLSDNTGLQLVDVVAATAVTTAHDRVVWQKPAISPSVLTAPASGSSLQRIPNNDGEYVLADASLTSFAAESPISPRDLWQAPVEPDPGTDPASEDPVDTTPDSGAIGLTDTPIADVPHDNSQLAPIVTEILPNPVAPLTDAHDEFIELYNPNDTAFNLAGYTLETGAMTLHDFTFAAPAVIKAHAYQAFYSVDTHLSLSNSGGQVRLIDLTKKIVSQTDVYTAAADGKAWAFIGSIWQWTTAPTPNTANVLSTVVSTPTKAVATKTTKPKVKGTNTIKVAKTKTAKAKKVKTTKKKAKKTTIKPASSHLASVVQPTPIHAGVLAAVAIAAVLYALYEYRFDVANFFFRLRSNRSFRRKAGGKVARR